MSIDLRGRVVLITGVTHGIGEATGRLLRQLGATVYGVGRDEAKGRLLESEVGIVFRRVDLSRRVEVLDFIKWFESEVGVIHALINNASRNSRFSILDTALEEWDSMIELNLTAPFLLSQMAARLMIKRGIRGKIINVAAIQAHFPLESSFPYVTTKGGLVAMTRSMAVDLGKYGIQAITVTPGPVYVKGGEVPKSLDDNAATLIGRMGRPMEVAWLIAFLISDLNTFMTGNEIIIDGGRIISRKPDPREVTTGEV
ncbi:SDR family NAD(P)-dependent oxidoreductase [Caldivirga sp. UBA161]|uniref:SDR family NAD(P)-dependent oxidoreductase n=1 Tax=Caldivirga sp. UBA161 TaxID=1915569 RepID=UPI0025C581BF|nr:SDR family oxidoreductase [Caldivirga sp. UBA161]